MSNSSNGQSKIKVGGMTIAVTEMQKMIDFYQNVFELDFEEVDMYNAKLFKSNLDKMEVLFCPASIAQNTATQNRHQLTLEVDDLELILKRVSKHKGEIMGEKLKNGAFFQIGIKDPDNNSILLTQRVMD